MMNFKKLSLTIGVCLLMALSSSAQYSTAIGARLNYGYGLTVKHKMTPSKAIEGILYSRWRGINLTGLYEIHKPAFSVPNWNWYYGVGGHLGFWGDGNKHGNPWFDNRESTTVLGADGIVGLEYTVREIPLNLSIDWKPTLNLIGYQGLWLDDIALSIRFAIK